MSTLLFCTSYATNEHDWRLRYGRWVTQARRCGLQFDRMALIDDGSPWLPPWVGVVEAGDDAPGVHVPATSVEMHRFPNNLGRRGILDFPGWYRSFAYAATLGRRMGADKLVHIESDAALLSREIVEWLNSFDEGWGTPWSPSYGFPEMAIQVIAGSALATFGELFARPYDWLRDRIHETALPYTHVVRPFKGDRHVGEEEVGRDLDFLTQIPFTREDGFAWWEQGLSDSTPPDVPEIDDTVFRWDFTPHGEAARRCGLGWATPESHCRWTVGLDSVASLPSNVPAAALIVELSPCVDPLRHPFQKLEVHLNGVELARFKIKRHSRLRIPLPGGTTGAGRLRLHHPDAVQPRYVDPRIDDGRELGLYISTLAGSKT